MKRKSIKLINKKKHSVKKHVQKKHVHKKHSRKPVNKHSRKPVKPVNKHSRKPIKKHNHKKQKKKIRTFKFSEVEDLDCINCKRCDLKQAILTNNKSEVEELGKAHYEFDVNKLYIMDVPKQSDENNTFYGTFMALAADVSSKTRKKNRFDVLDILIDKYDGEVNYPARTSHELSEGEPPRTAMEIAIYKKDVELIQFLKRKQKQLSSGCVNEDTPIAFEPLSDIPKKRIVKLDNGNCIDVLEIKEYADSNARGIDRNPFTNQPYGTSDKNKIIRRLKSLGIFTLKDGRNIDNMFKITDQAIRQGFDIDAMEDFDEDVDEDYDEDYD